MPTHHDTTTAAHTSARVVPQSDTKTASVDNAPLTASTASLPGLLTHPNIHQRGNGSRQQNSILQLQRVQGNHTVQRLLQRTPGQTTATDQAQALLRQAIAIVETALMVGADSEHSEGSEDLRAEQPLGDATLQTNAQPIAGEVQNDGLAKPHLNPEQLLQLQTALQELRSLEGSGRADEIMAACQPIVQAAQGKPLTPNQMETGAEPIQRAAVAAAPLVLLGPPGWVVGTVVVVGGLVIWAATRDRRSSSSGRAMPRAMPRAVPRANTRTQRRSQHMGNIHVQGNDLRGSIPNFAWNQPTPMTKSAAIRALQSLRSSLTSRQQAARVVAFRRAETFINNTWHDAPPVLFRTFTDPRSSLQDQRVDIEIISGEAFR